MTTMAMMRISPRPCSESWKAWAEPWNIVAIVDGSVVLARSLIWLTAFDAVIVYLTWQEYQEQRAARTKKSATP